jgi:hypothetical protein
VVALMAPVAFVPLVASEPLQPPDAVQAVALVADQVNVALPPLATLAALVLSETLGGMTDTVTVADCDAEPPVPLQVSVKFVFAVSDEVVCEPVVALLPLQPPDAVQEVALVEDQVNVDVAPLSTVLGFVLRVTAGAALVTETVADCAALPPLPVQVSA